MTNQIALYHITPYYLFKSPRSFVRRVRGVWKSLLPRNDWSGPSKTRVFTYKTRQKALSGRRGFGGVGDATLLWRRPGSKTRVFTYIWRRPSSKTRVFTYFWRRPSSKTMSSSKNSCFYVSAASAELKATCFHVQIEDTVRKSGSKNGSA